VTPSKTALKIRPMNTAPKLNGKAKFYSAHELAHGLPRVQDKVRGGNRSGRHMFWTPQNDPLVWRQEQVDVSIKIKTRIPHHEVAIL
jgi:hypothetical protein